MLITETQLRSLILEELRLISESDTVDSALEIAKTTTKDIEREVSKISRLTGEAKKTLDKTIGGMIPISLSSALGNFRRFIRNGLLKPLRATKEVLDVIAQLKEISDMIRDGADPQDAIELVFVTGAREFAERASIMLALATGGFFGWALGKGLEPLAEIYQDRIDEILDKMERDSEGVDWDGLWDMMCKSYDMPGCALQLASDELDMVGSGLDDILAAAEKLKGPSHFDPTA